MSTAITHLAFEQPIVELEARVRALEQASKHLHAEQVARVFHGVGNVGLNLLKPRILQVIPRPAERPIPSKPRSPGFPRATAMPFLQRSANGPTPMR